MSGKRTSNSINKRPRTDGELKGNNKPITKVAEETEERVGIPTSFDLLNPELLQKIHKVWEENVGGYTANVASSDDMHRKVKLAIRTTHPIGVCMKEASVASQTVPSYKVGTLEMYKRFPDAYDAFMHHHDCSAVHAYLVCEVLEGISKAARRAGDAAGGRGPSEGREAPAGLRVADFGCGTGRIGAMVLGHPAVRALFAYDEAPAMLRRCLLNTVAAAAASGLYDAVHLLPTAAAGLFAGEAAARVLAPADRGGGGGRVLRLVCRPCAFAAIPNGLFAGGAHAGCDLVVCAWALSYVVRRQWAAEGWRGAVEAVVEGFLRLLDTARSAAAVVVIETLGNGADAPTRRTVLGDYLESRFGFQRRWVRTDYTFASMAEATHMCRFFFGGDRMRDQLEVVEGDNGPGKVVLKECTGIWTLWKPQAIPS